MTKTTTNAVKTDRKATTQGHCQCCGSLQKLPNGVLSKHGYTVDCGFFNGTCQGAGYLPFEQDCSLVKKFVEIARRQLETNEKTQTKLRQPAAEPKCWVQEYISGNFSGKRSRYISREIEIVTETKTLPDGYTFNTYSYIGTDGKNKRLDAYGHNDTALSVATYFNDQEANRYERIAKQIRTYIQWQNERVINWKPQPLTLVI